MIPIKQEPQTEVAEAMEHTQMNQSERDVFSWGDVSQLGLDDSQTGSMRRRRTALQRFSQRNRSAISGQCGRAVVSHTSIVRQTHGPRAGVGCQARPTHKCRNCRCCRRHRRIHKRMKLKIVKLIRKNKRVMKQKRCLLNRLTLLVPNTNI